MNWSAFVSALLGSIIPTTIGAAVMLFVKWRIDGSLERLRADLQHDLMKVTKWHDKRVEALETIYQAFVKYLDFLRRTLYVRSEGASMDPMHDFRNTLEQKMLYLDDSMTRKISEYQGELLLFWNSAVTNLASEGEIAREQIRQKLDYEIPAYLPRLQKDINEFLDPEYDSTDSDFRARLATALSKK